MTLTDEEQAIVMKVAEYVGKVGIDTGKQFTTDDEEEARYISAILASMSMEQHVDCLKDTAQQYIKAKQVHNTSIELWTYLCLVTNWLSWGWHENGRDDLSEQWAKVWHELNDWSLDNLKGDEKKYYIETVD